jgi:hypothetical protein
MLTDNRRYDGPVGLAALDPTVAAYKNFIEKNKNEPIYNFLNSQQGKKVDPNLAAAMIVLKEMEDAKKNAPSGPMPTTSVVQDIGQAGLQLASQMKQQDMRDAGLAMLPAPAMDQAQFQGGIADVAPQPQEMDGGIKQMAGGGPIAFDGGGATSRPSMTSQLGVPGSGLAGIDFSQMAPEQLEILSKDRDPTISRAAGRELLKRTGYVSPGDMISNYAAAVRGGIEGPPAIRFSNERKFPSYMYDEQGNVRKGEVTGGIAGTPYYSSSNAPLSAATSPTAPATAPAVATAPMGMVTPDNAGSAFDAAIANARRDVSQGAPATGQEITDRAAAVTAADRDAQTNRGRVYGQINKMKEGVDTLISDAKAPEPKFDDVFAQVGNTYEKLGVGKAINEYANMIKGRQAEIDKDYKQDRWMAVAQAGFAMAQAAAANPQAGFLGALAVGGMEGGKQYTAALKEYRKATSQLQDAQFSVAQAQENLKMNQDKEARGIYNQQIARLDRKKEIAAQASLDLSKTMVSAETQLAISDASQRTEMAKFMFDPVHQAIAEQRAKGLGPTAALGAVTAAKQVDDPNLRQQQAQFIFSQLNKDGAYERLSRKQARTPDAMTVADIQQLQQLQRAFAAAAGGSGGVNMGMGNPFGLKQVR